MPKIVAEQTDNALFQVLDSTNPRGFEDAQALLVCVFFSLQTISAIVKSRLAGDAEWSKNSGQRFARISKYTFLVGIFLFALFAFVSLLFIKIDETSAPPAIQQVIKVGPTSTVH